MPAPRALRIPDFRYDVEAMRSAVAEQRAQNDQLRERNQSLDAEVVNLKQSSEAAEERARTDLGMIGPEETFYQVVPVASATH